MRYAIDFLLICMSMTICMANAVSQTPEQKEVTVFMQKMYSYSVSNFEARIFDSKDVPQKQCLLLRQFFDSSVLTKEDARWHGCDIVGNNFVRYPGLEGEELNGVVESGGRPKVSIGTPQADGEKMSVSTKSKYGRTVFFLTKAEKGWRIENALYYEDWPLGPDAKCWSKFLVKPDDWHKKSEQPVCRQ